MKYEAVVSQSISKINGWSSSQRFTLSYLKLKLKLILLFWIFIPKYSFLALYAILFVSDCAYSFINFGHFTSLDGIKLKTIITTVYLRCYSSIQGRGSNNPNTGPQRDHSSFSTNRITGAFAYIDAGYPRKPGDRYKYYRYSGAEK